MTDEQNQPTGIDVELARALATSLGKELVIRNTAFDGLIPALQTGKLDLIISSMTITAKRAETIDFSDPYVHMGICLLVNAGSNVQRPDDLNAPSRKVVVKNGTTGFFFAQEHLPQAQLLQVSEAGACVLEVVQGKADAFIYDQFSVFQYQRQNARTTRAVLEPLRREDWGIGVRKGNGELLSQVNAFLTDFRAQHGLETIAAKIPRHRPRDVRANGQPFFLPKMISDPTKRFSSRVENYVRFPPRLSGGGAGCPAGRMWLDGRLGRRGRGFRHGHFQRGFAEKRRDSVRRRTERRDAAGGRAVARRLPALHQRVGCGRRRRRSRMAASIWSRPHRRSIGSTAREHGKNSNAILKPGGGVALIWNDRQLDSTAFHREYEKMLQRFGTDYVAVRNRDLDLADVRDFIGGDVKQTTLENSQVLDYEGVEGRLLSSSYAPESGRANHAPMLAALREIFDRYAENGESGTLLRYARFHRPVPRTVTSSSGPDYELTYSAE